MTVSRFMSDPDTMMTIEGFLTAETMRWLMLPAGGLCGYLYYRWIGCRSGMCMLTSTPWSSSLAGVLLFYLLFF